MKKTLATLFLLMVGLFTTAQGQNQELLLSQSIAQAAAAYEQTLLVNSGQAVALSQLLSSACSYLKLHGGKCGNPRAVATAYQGTDSTGPTTYDIGSESVPVGTQNNVGVFPIPLSDNGYINVQLDATDLETKPGVVMTIEFDYSPDGGNTWYYQGGGTNPGGIPIPGNTMSMALQIGQPVTAASVARVIVSISGQAVTTSGFVQFCGGFDGEDCTPIPQ
jgi:hypothetical protein